jgi:hypothetical protein
VDDVRRVQAELDRAVDGQVQRVERERAVRIGVLPVELVRVDLDDERVVVLDSASLHRRDPREGEDRESREDDGGNRRPDDLDPGVAVDLRALGPDGRVPAPAEADDEVDERRLHQHEDDCADREDDPVEVADGLAARRLGGRGSEAGIAGQRRADGKQCREHGERDGGNKLPDHRAEPF